MKKILVLALAMVTTLGLIGCSNTENKKAEQKTEKQEGKLTVFAAASLKISLEDIIKEFNKKYPNIKVDLNTNGSDKLYNQMKEGAQTDLYISASSKWMKEAVKSGIIDEKDQKPLLKNEVVMIRNIKAKELKLKDLKDGKDLCLGAESVPVGRYSKKYFEKIGVWDKIAKDTSFEPKVTDVVKKVAEGARNYGLVYKTDANSEIKNKTIDVCDKVPKEAGIKVVYPIGIPKKAMNKDNAKLFMKFLEQGIAKDILEDVGFVYVD